MTHETTTVGRFAGLADRYDRYRPDYPEAALAALLAGLPVPADVADVGAGTGISTRALVRAGARAIAVEPNDEMRAFATSRGVDARPGAADATGLPAKSVDAVAYLQAFHWFAHPATLAEAARVLKPGGRVAIVWNDRDLTTEFGREYRELERRHSRPDKLAGADFSDDRLAPLFRASGFGDPALQTFANVQRFDLDGAIGRMFSSSYVPRSGPECDALVAGLRALVARCADGDGTVELRYRTELWIAEPTR